MNHLVDFNELVGKTLSRVEKHDDLIEFVTVDGVRYQQYHVQDCCESVTVDDVCGDLNDLVGSPILRAEENSNADGDVKDKWDDSYTWTFYRLETAKGSVVIKWYGTSNGYYSESVDTYRVD